MNRFVRNREGGRAQGAWWDRMCRFSLTRDRLSRKRLAQFCREFATDERTLVVHCVDVDHKRFFPNSVVISSREGQPADVRADKHYTGLAEISDSSFGLIVCTGLLEHIPDPPRVIAQLHRILRPGGRLVLSASAVFPFHGAPDNFFHFTPGGFRHLFRDWSGFEVLRGATRPFETISILLQRINMQCDIFPPVRLLIEVLFHLMPLLDSFILRQYASNRVRNKESATDSFMPVTLHAIVLR